MALKMFMEEKQHEEVCDVLHRLGLYERLMRYCYEVPTYDAGFYTRVNCRRTVDCRTNR